MSDIPLELVAYKTISVSVDKDRQGGIQTFDLVHFVYDLLK